MTWLADFKPETVTWGEGEVIFIKPLAAFRVYRLRNAIAHRMCENVPIQLKPLRCYNNFMEV